MTYVQVSKILGAGLEEGSEGGSSEASFSMNHGRRQSIMGSRLSSVVSNAAEGCQTLIEPTSPGPHVALMLTIPGPHANLMPTIPGPCVIPMPTIPGPHVTLMLTIPGPHVILPWQGGASRQWLPLPTPLRKLPALPPRGRPIARACASEDHTQSEQLTHSQSSQRITHSQNSQRITQCMLSPTLLFRMHPVRSWIRALCVVQVDDAWGTHAYTHALSALMDPCAVCGAQVLASLAAAAADGVGASMTGGAVPAGHLASEPIGEDVRPVSSLQGQPAGVTSPEGGSPRAPIRRSPPPGSTLAPELQ